MNKTKSQLQIMYAALWLLAAIGSASAYYDPGPQRWLNRDPVGEGGGRNLHVFAGNSPSWAFDADGAAVTYIPQPSMQHGDPNNKIWNNTPAYPSTGPVSQGCSKRSDEGKLKGPPIKVWRSCPGCDTHYSCDAGDRCKFMGTVGDKPIMGWEHFEENCTFCPGGG